MGCEPGHSRAKQYVICDFTHNIFLVYISFLKTEVAPHIGFGFCVIHKHFYFLA